MNVTVNGDLRDVTPDTTVVALMETLSLKPALTAVQLNEVILSKEDLSTTLLSEGDRLELIRIVGGG
ncbi:MAG: sulfur carrier protein ThiS [Candidatus Hydrogenedentes bacterium]|jgi:sulfur carrier protein|nr:sulfur carrier protein ThiS [Candidatus Hydrogenedentota bacterium]